MLYSSISSEVVGEILFLYFDPHPTRGFIVLHRKTSHIPESYVIYTREKNPSDLDQIINQVLKALNLDKMKFYVKSQDFGNEYIELYTYTN
jgi:hypothetical protein